MRTNGTKDDLSRIDRGGREEAAIRQLQRILVNVNLTAAGGRAAGAWMTQLTALLTQGGRKAGQLGVQRGAVGAAVVAVL